LITCLSESLKYDQIISNIKQALLEEKKNSDLSSKFVKICWMGMGEAIVTPTLVKNATLEILNWIMDNNLALGLDGVDISVDISTVLPKIKHDFVTEFVELNQELEKFKLNPNNKNVVNKERGNLVEYDNRSHFRLFYSLHSAIQPNRELIMPNCMKIEDAIPKLKELKNKGVNVIIHHMFLDKINDSKDEVDALICLMKEHFLDNELRILRYNNHEKSNIVESSMFEQRMCYLTPRVKNVKVQVSYGLDVKSACGQFIYNKVNKLEKFKVET